ncbi:MAG: DUF5076 domain-containing protein [Bradyrhizobiaceae bacterium]|nr:DUF5076 domain-containing protein [Bradyrhizobiaceae bacterium]
MVFSPYNPYNTLPVADEALDKGGVELLRAGLAEKDLYVTVRRHFDKPDRWGGVLADVTLHLAALYSQDGDLTKDNVIALVAQTYGEALRAFVKSAGRKPAKAVRPSAKTAGKAKGLARSKAKAPARLKTKSRTAAKSKSVAGRKSRRR